MLRAKKRARGPLASAGLGLTVLLLTSCAGYLEEQASSPVPSTRPSQQAVETREPSASQPSAFAWDLSPRRDDAGQVIIDVQPVGLSADQRSWEFDVALNTHSVDLDNDLIRAAVLRCERGRTHTPVSWEGSPPGGHHRQGVLRFAALDHPSSFLELVIQDVGGISERVFRWEARQAKTPASPEPAQPVVTSPVIEPTVSSAEVASIYETFVCPCCGMDIGSCTCDMAEERRGVIDQQVALGASQGKVRRAMYLAYGAGVFFDQEQAATVRVEVLAELPSERPALVIEPDELDLGSVPISDGSVSGAYTVRNAGQTDLIITGLQTTCGCTTAVVETDQGTSPTFGSNPSENPTDWSMTLAPGEEAQLVATFDTLFHGPDATGQFRRVVAVISNDPLNSRLDIAFVVEVTR